MLDIGHFLDMEIFIFISLLQFTVYLKRITVILSQKSLLSSTRKRHTQTNKAINLFLLALINDLQLS